MEYLSNAPEQGKLRWGREFSRYQVIAVKLLLFVMGYIQANSVVADDPPEPIRIASWNVEWFFDDYAGDNRSDLAKEQTSPSRDDWRWKLTRVAETIAALEPTILALQEVETNQVLFQLVKELEDKHQIKYRYAFIPGYDFFTEQNVAFLYRDGLVEYSRREQSSEIFQSKDYYNLNKHLFARFEFGKGDQRQSLVLLNLHLKSGADSEATRVRQGRLAHHWLRSQIVAGENVIVLGDLNTENGIEVAATSTNDIGVIRGLYSPRSEDDLVDLHQHLDANQHVTHITIKQFDRILISPALAVDEPNQVDLTFNRIVTRRDLVIGEAADEVEAHFNRLYEISRDERDVSDHYPIMAEFVFK